MLQISFIILFQISLTENPFIMLTFILKFPSLCLHLILLFYVPSIIITSNIVKALNSGSYIQILKECSIRVIHT